MLAVAYSIALTMVLAASMIHPVAVVVPQPAQARSTIREMEHNLSTDDYNDIYRLSYSSLHVSRATFLAHTPHTPPPKGTIVRITETGPWVVTAMGKPAVVQVSQPIQIYTRLPGKTAQTWGSEIMLMYIKGRWYWEG